MVESGLGDRFWFKSALAGCEGGCNLQSMDCRAWVHLNSERREHGKPGHAFWAIEVMYLEGISAQYKKGQSRHSIQGKGIQ